MLIKAIKTKIESRVSSKLITDLIVFCFFLFICFRILLELGLE